MIRGIAFQIPNEYGQWLTNILASINCTMYDWYIGAGEEYKLMEGELVPLFPENSFHPIVDGAALLQYIHTDSPQYIIHADLKAFPRGTPITHLETHEDFLASGCELVVLIIDCSYTSIYCKDPGMLNKLYSNMEAYSVQSLTYITDDNDFRTKLAVW